MGNALVLPGRGQGGRGLAAAVLAASTALAQACGSGAGDAGRGGAGAADGSSATPARGGTAKVGVIAEPKTFLDWAAETTVDSYAADLVFRRLARRSSVSGSFVPDLAESWQTLPDGRTIAFQLRRGVLWEDGIGLTASDVRFTEDRARMPEASISGYKEAIESVEATGSHQVVFHFRRPDPEMLAHAVLGHVYPEHLLGSVDARDLQTLPFHRRPVGSGPFRLAEWEPARYLSFVARRDGTPGERPHLDRVVMRIFADKTSALRELEGGGLDLLFKVPRETADRLASRGDLTIHRVPTHGYVFVVWNTKRAPWSRVEVRQALAASIDRKALASRFEGTETALASGPVPADHPWHDPAPSSTSYEPAATAARLTSVGWRISGDGRWLDEQGAKVRLEILVQHGNTVLQDTAAVVADNLRRVGLEAEVRQMDLTTLRARVEEKGDFDAALYSRPSTAPVDLAGCFGSGGAENYAKLADPDLETMLDAFGRETDLEKARETFVRAARRVGELEPWTFLYYRSETIAASRRLRGLEGCLPNVMECASEWWIPKDRQ